jgi:hypothetical protein
MNKKIKLIIFFLSFFYFGLTFAGSWMDPNGNYMDSTDKNDPNYNDIQYWKNAMKNGLIDGVLRCMPSAWKTALSNFDFDDGKLIIKLSNKDVDSFKSPSDPACGGYSGVVSEGVMFLRTEQNYENINGCYCPEATILHELIHFTTGIHDDYNSKIDACVFRALIKARVANCPNLPQPAWCECEDQEENRSFCKD